MHFEEKEYMFIYSIYSIYTFNPTIYMERQERNYSEKQFIYIFEVVNVLCFLE